jgi:hypothetical protein
MKNKMNIRYLIVPAIALACLGSVGPLRAEQGSPQPVLPTAYPFEAFDFTGMTISEAARVAEQRGVVISGECNLR